MTFDFEGEDYKATIKLYEKDLRLYRWYQLKRKYRNWKFKRYVRKNPKVAITIDELIDRIDDYLAFGSDENETKKV